MYPSRSLFTYLKQKAIGGPSCAVCGESFIGNVEDLVFCKHHHGVAHLNCCINHCSKDHQPCRHSIGMYRKAEYTESW